MTPEQTRAQHRAQRDLVARSMLLADTPEERHGTYRRRHVSPLPLPLPVLPPAHVYRLPDVHETRRLS